MRPTGDMDEFDEQMGRLAALGDPIRRVLYRYVASQREPVSRERAATDTGVALHVAKFHLDRLEAEGLLEADYSRPPGRSGPGAGRPAKQYRRAAREVSVSLPERRYELAGHIMAGALVAATRSGASPADALHESAGRAGRELGDQVRARLGKRTNPTACIRAVSGVLAEQGYEPSEQDGVVTLANCPFHALAHEHPDVVCDINLHLIEGMLGVCDGGCLRARLQPAPGRCCVTLTRQGRDR